MSIPSDHLFFTVSMGMSSMREPQRPWEISPHIAKPLSQQHISHPGERLSLVVNSKCRSISLSQTEIRREYQSRLSRFSFHCGFVAFLLLREISSPEKHRGIFLFNSSSGGKKEKRLDLRLLLLNVEEYILVRIH